MALGVAAFTFFSCAALTAPVGRYDEGLALYDAERVATGDVPYRDFFVLYGPGQFYSLAAIFRLFGHSVAVERVYSCLITASSISKDTVQACQTADFQRFFSI
jgi:hypothetical protein